MIVYNVTTNVTWAIHDEWLQWIQREYVPGILETGCFFESRILRLLEIDDEEGRTYAIQFHALSIENYQHFVEQHETSFREKYQQKWRDQMIAFSSLMEVLH